MSENPVPPPLSGQVGPPVTEGPDVRLDEDGGLPWRPVSPRLAALRTVAVSLWFALPVVAAAALAVLVWSWFWVAVVVLVLLLGWLLWVVRRQVPAISWAELDEELVIRRGLAFRSLVSVPYGRLQYVDVQSGPLARRFGLAEVELHTASPSSGGAIPGLPLAEAEALRTRLAARGESQRAGL